MWKSNYKSMNYEQLSREAEKLSKNWFINFEKLSFIYTEMKLKVGG